MLESYTGPVELDRLGLNSYSISGGGRGPREVVVELRKEHCSCGLPCVLVQHHRAR